MNKAAPIKMSEVICLGILTGIAIFMRWPAVNNPGFHNEDVAGITYNADLLINGFLPLVDNLEYKAPGAFCLRTRMVGGWTVFHFAVDDLRIIGSDLFGHVLHWVASLWPTSWTLGRSLVHLLVSHHRQHGCQLRVLDDWTLRMVFCFLCFGA